MAVVGIIGGSGLEDPGILEAPGEVAINTPYGPPSAPLRKGTLGDTRVLLLSRHGRQHTIPPTQVNNRANIWALRAAGATHIVTTTAVGSLREEIAPGNLAILDQFIDFTRHRSVTFYDEFNPGDLKHTPMAEPFSADLRNVIIETCRDLEIPCHERATVITVEGPRFSTRAESRMFQAWGADVINMSTAPECILANEFGLPYATIAMATDYDCWREEEDPVTWEAVLKTFRANAEKVKGLLVALIPRIRSP